LDIKTSHISFWLVDVVRRDYNACPDVQLHGQVNDHELRALSASWAYASSVAFEDIKSALYWNSNYVFQAHYLRDMSAQSARLSAGPSVVAGRVVGPTGPR
jgi:hypothetical protein